MPFADFFVRKEDRTSRCLLEAKTYNASSFSLPIEEKRKPNVVVNKMSELYINLRAQTDFVLAILSFTMVPVVLIGNLLVIISLIKFKFRFRNVTNLFIGSLSVADCLLGVLTLPIYASFYLDGERLASMKFLCLCKFSSCVCSMSASLTSLVAIAVDRYIAIIHPLKYPMIMTRRRAFAIIFFLWVYNSFLFAFPFMVNNYRSDSKECDFFQVLPQAYSLSSTFGAIFICLAATLYMYIRIFRVAQKHKKRVNKYKKTLKSSSDKKFERETKSAKTMAIILFLFYAFWIPFMVTGPLKYLNLDKNLSEAIKSITLFIAMSNSGVNPILYCWMRKDFKAAFKAIILCYSRAQSEETFREASVGSNGEMRKNGNLDSPEETKGPKHNPVTKVGSVGALTDGVTEKGHDDAITAVVCISKDTRALTPD